MCPKTGIVFNNEMDDFSIPNQNNQGSQRDLPPSPYNYISNFELILYF